MWKAGGVKVRTRSLGIVLGVVMVGTGLFGGRDDASAIPPPCFEQTPTIVANGPITKGTSHTDIIFVPSNVATTVYGYAGNDVICNDSPASTVYGGAGDDQIDGVGRLYGDAGNDTITGHELIVGQRTRDVYGGAGNDNINVEDVNLVDGGSGDDVVLVDHANRVRGGSGNDFVQVDNTDDVLGDSGDDHIHIVDTDFLDCGSGRDVYADNGAVGATTIRRCEINELV